MSGHGVTRYLRWFSREMKHREPETRAQRPRDRSLRGKARIKARRSS